MAELTLWADVSQCIGCFSCELACKQENNVAEGAKWIHISQVGPQQVGKKLRLSFVPMVCMHCGKPTCLTACPEKAISKRADGIVLIDPELCTGCKACVESCKFGAMQFDEKKGVAEKCTLCLHRLQQGVKPSCVISCPAGALLFGDVNRMSEVIRERRAKFLADVSAE